MAFPAVSQLQTNGMISRSRASYSYAMNGELDNVFTVLMYDCPELFFVDMNGFMYTHSGMDIRYRFQKAEYETISAAIHYGWVFYPPNESHRCIYAVPNES